MSFEGIGLEPNPAAMRVPLSRPFQPFEKGEIEQSIGSRFEKIARTHADRPAVLSPGGVVVTYAQLNASANRAARILRSQGASRSKPVALLLEAGAPLFAAMLGSLKAGRFYVPLDPALGPARLRAIFDGLSAEILVTDNVGLSVATEIAGRRVRVLRVEELTARGSSGGFGASVSPEDLAYVLFTSGSTGTPKGVIQNHRNVLHNVLKLTNGLRISPEDRITLLSSVSFGASVSDIYAALLNGAAVCPFSLRGDGLRHLPSFVAAEGITIYHSVPSVFRSFAAALNGSEDLSRLRVIKLGGEAVLASDFEFYRAHFPRTCLFHVGLGATEMNVIRQWFADHDTPWPPASPLGYGVDETEVVLLDEEGRETAGTGEITVIGRTLAVGYWNDPRRTAEAFPPAPGRGGVRMYRTGDFGRLLPDGCLLYLGRKDSRVKVRGHRVETGEVEAALAAVSGVRETAVAGREGPGGTRLVAYIVALEAGRPGIGALRRALAGCLPGYMIPASFVFLKALPRTAGGKVDRNALPDPEPVRPALETDFVAPRDEREHAVADIFAKVLGLDRVGADDDFFELGGNSLLAVEVLSRLADLFGASLGAADLLEASTPATLAARALAGGAAPGTLVTLQRGGERRPVFLVPGGAGDGEDLFVSARLARHVGPAFPFFGFRSVPAPHPQIEELAARHVHQIRSVQPYGPYLLVGECVGGILALAMARKLREEGEQVALLALLDTPCPTRWRRLYALLLLRAPWGQNLLQRLLYFFGRVRHHRDVLRALSRGRLGYALRKARIAAQGFVSAASAHRRPTFRRRASYVGHLLASRPARFDGRIGLVESEEGRRSGFAAAWARLAPQIEVVQGPGDHYSYIVDHVDRVAETLRRWLDEADPGGTH